MRWTLDTINWKLFQKDKLDPEILKALKAAALVEYNAPDYVGYLCNVFRDYPDVQQLIRDWGEEESQHGRALAAYARACTVSDTATAILREHHTATGASPYDSECGT